MKIFKTILINLVLLSLFIIPVFVYAQGTPTTPPADTNIGVSIPNPFKGGIVYPNSLQQY